MCVALLYACEYACAWLHASVHGGSMLEQCAYMRTICFYNHMSDFSWHTWHNIIVPLLPNFFHNVSARRGVGIRSTPSNYFSSACEVLLHIVGKLGKLMLIPFRLLRYPTQPLLNWLPDRDMTSECVGTFYNFLEVLFFAHVRRLTRVENQLQRNGQCLTFIFSVKRHSLLLLYKVIDPGRVT